MKRQTVLEYLKERKIKMYENICPICKDHLDPGEKCKCQLIEKMQKFAESGKKVNVEVNRADFTGVEIKKVTDQEVVVKDLHKRLWEIDIDAVVDVK